MLYSTPIILETADVTAMIIIVTGTTGGEGYAHLSRTPNIIMVYSNSLISLSSVLSWLVFILK